MTKHMVFDGIQNFRDFGGYATACGRGLKAGLLFRSANHHRATEADLQRLRDLGVAVIVDLRQPHEREREPSRRWPGFDGEVVENDAAELNPDFETEARAAPELSPAWFHEHCMGFYARAPFEARYQDL
ncbi:MAG: protein tyrosine phosphatase, partial [Phenylobacterium sp.]|nr:protein tyrosine phosphatase [Phenylobacterium sp.]